MERHGGDFLSDHQEFNPNSYSGNPCSWSSVEHRPNFSDNGHHHRRRQQYDQMNGEPNDFFGCQPPPFAGRKRGFHHPAPDHIDGGIPAKLYVAPVPRTATVEDIRPLFEEHGSVIEVVLPRDKRTGQQQGYCFVKYMTFEEAGRAIRALNSQYTFPGEQAFIKVRFADGERERPVAPPEKLYVGCLSKQTTKREIEEIFSPYGHIEDIYIVRDELKQSRGCAFVQFSHREMAMAAMKGLNGTLTMRGSDQPLVVRIADPKKPKIAELRGNHAFGNPSFGPDFQEPIRPAPNFGDSTGGQILPNVSYPSQHISNNSQAQVGSNWANQEAAAPIVMQQLHSSQQQSPSQLSQVILQQKHTPPQISQLSQQAFSEMRQPLTQNIEQQKNSQVTRLESPKTGHNPCTSPLPKVPQSPQTRASPECDWSEHTCPDGFKYYFNCVTCESKWDKPEEYILFEQQLQKHQSLQNTNQHLSCHSSDSSTKEVAQTQEVQLQTHIFHKKLQLQQPSMSTSHTVPEALTMQIDN